MIFTEQLGDGRTAVFEQEPQSTVRSVVFESDDPCEAAAFAAVLDDPAAVIFTAREGFVDAVIRGFRANGITKYPVSTIPGC